MFQKLILILTIGEYLVMYISLLGTSSVECAGDGLAVTRTFPLLTHFSSKGGGINAICENTARLAEGMD